MTAQSDFCTHLQERAARAGIIIRPEELTQLSQYYDLLVRWNRTVNLTALLLVPRPATPDARRHEALDRLFVEPLVAARYVPELRLTWLDVGSGGGSPAIPLKIVRPKTRLIMTEPKHRKAAFLREVVRHLALNDCEVLTQRFEGSIDVFRGALDMITIRAVRLDAHVAEAAKKCLKRHGRLFAFGTPVPAEAAGLIATKGSPVNLLGDTADDDASNRRRLFLYDLA